LTQDLNFYQLQRLESLVKLIVERRVSQEEFRKLLQKKYIEGGIDISPSLATVMAKKVGKILSQAEDAQRFRRRFMHNNFYSREHILIHRLTNYLIDEYKGELTPLQKRRLKELVYKRVAGLISRKDFKDSLRLSLEKGGIGMKIVASRKLTLYFEKILMQGTESKGHGH
jgi:hypothetical protein